VVTDFDDGVDGANPIVVINVYKLFSFFSIKRVLTFFFIFPTFSFLKTVEQSV